MSDPKFISLAEAVRKGMKIPLSTYVLCDKLATEEFSVRVYPPRTFGDDMWTVRIDSASAIPIDQLSNLGFVLGIKYALGGRRVVSTHYTAWFPS